MAQSHPIAHLRKNLLPQNRVRPTGYLILPSGISEARDEWLDLQNQVWRAEMGRRQDWTVSWYQREFVRNDAQSRIWFARLWRSDSGSEACGTISLELPSSRRDMGWIRWLAVSPAWRNRGVGTALLLHAENEAWRLGCSVASAETLRSWTAAMHLYLRLGYRESVR